ncbi:MAG TPA: hypothetical protein P5567_00360 [Kiritimatiellia bacterium]|nr:hypothetical protein [Kiritimatiellia bacterium]HRZ10886.1 hypothetical protein [Kiritimatiellia bacterium]HSA18841.1 hypothetical protein [Kiritimatiellia bacterium]
MSSFPKLQLDPPTDWPSFEDLCWGLWKTIWRDENTQKNGRGSQPQHGVDVFGRPGKASTWAGVQCKGKEVFTHQALTPKEIGREVKKARKFKPPLSEFMIATTAPRDASLQELARKVTARHAKRHWFSLTVLGWHDIVELLLEYEPPIASRFYPLVFGEGVKGVLWKIEQRLTESPDRDSIAADVPYYAADDSPCHSQDLLQTSQDSTITVSVTMEQPNPGNPIRARDALKALSLLAQIQEICLAQADKNGATSFDATLTSAIDQAKARRNSRDKADGGAQ